VLGDSGFHTHGCQISYKSKSQLCSFLIDQRLGSSYLTLIRGKRAGLHFTDFSSERRQGCGVRLDTAADCLPGESWASQSSNLAGKGDTGIVQLVLVEALRGTLWTGVFNLEAAVGGAQLQSRTDVARVPGAGAGDRHVPMTVVWPCAGDRELLEGREAVVCETVETGDEGSDGGILQVEGAVILPVVEQLKALVLRLLIDEEEAVVGIQHVVPHAHF
jgi:hypothetical protein